MSVVGDKVFPRTSRTWHPSSVGARVQAAEPSVPAMNDDAEVEIARILLARAQEALSRAFTGARCRDREDQRLLEMERACRTVWCDVVAYQLSREGER